MTTLTAFNTAFRRAADHTSTAEANRMLIDKFGTCRAEELLEVDEATRELQEMAGEPEAPNGTLNANAIWAKFNTRAAG